MHEKGTLSKTSLLIYLLDHTKSNKSSYLVLCPKAFSDGLSSLNMVKDISNSPEYEMLFGFTEDEIKVGLENVIPGWKR